MTSVLVAVYLWLLAGAQMALAIGYVASQKWHPMWAGPFALVLVGGLIATTVILYRVGWFQ